MNDHRVGALLENRYRVLRRIARGGTAAVYEGLDERLDRPVALKIMHPHFADDPRFVTRAEREAKAAARLHDPHVVAVLDQGRTDDGVLYLVLEFVDGPTLREVVAREAPMDPHRALELLVPVLRGLARAHRTGLVHRDVKPENVLLTADGQVKVADFGLTRAVDDHTASTSVLGTVGYAAPELVGDGPVDQRSDVYAVGIMAYEMLTGSRPYTGTALQVATAHVSRDVPAPSGIAAGVSPALDEFVLRATSRDASRRPADAAELLDLALAVRRSLPAPADPLLLGEAATEVFARGSHSPTGHPEEAPTEAVGAGTADGSGEEATEAIGPGVQDLPTEAIGTPTREALTEALGTPWHEAPTEVVGANAGVPPGGHGTPILPAYEEDATGTVALTQVGSTAHRSPHEPRVRLNPPAQPLHVALVLVVFALLLTVAAFLGWWLGSAPGTATAMVPPVAGQDTAAAERTLNAAGISNVGVSTTPSREAPEGTVISTDPAAPATVRGIEQVNLLVSSGPAQVDVPALTGMSADDAGAAVSAAGLGLGGVTREYSTRPTGTVLSQSPEAGSRVDEGTQMSLTVATDSPQGPVPNVVGKDAETARTTLEEQGYTVQIDSPVGSHLNRVVRQREDGDTVVLTVL
ncbi:MULTISPECIES: protein kinase domain-containing protein [Kocuria]|uniref:protein kinase domain-containing protein n=1 Tax=Kocuria TaxID=57493 RepID=UPI0008A23A39|nr:MULTISPECIES: PASTA domain-containing protein [Kocuria]OFK08244.1 serine/threonine protein kinase [Kocuria sp. HMSC066H03]PKZ39146.1 serine/threonine-protein kinase [Kocuria rhizophila]